MDEPGSFLYSASGMALSASLSRPLSDSIPVQAAAMLPSIGGYHDARVENFRYKHVLSFDKAYTQVSGSRNPDDSTHNSLMSIVIEGLNVLDMLTADRIVARLCSKRNLKEPETRVTPTGTCFDNVRIGGYPLTIELDTTLFHTHDTRHAFKSAYESDAALRTELRKRFLWNGAKNDVPAKLRQRYKGYSQSNTLPETDGITPCTLVKSLKCDCPGVVCVGNAVQVPDFGVISVADYRMQTGKRQLTMLTLNLGSPLAGMMVLAEGQGNGGGG
jgi:hypothetical protein